MNNGFDWLDDQLGYDVVIKEEFNKPEELLEIEEEMLDYIEDMDEYCLNKGVMGGLDSGFPGINKALEGIQPGLILIAGQPNVGKSALCVQLAWQIALCNQEITEDKPHRAYVLYFSLDDNTRELLPRVIAIDKKIPINAVKSPKKYMHDKKFMEKRDSGIINLKNAISKFKIKDSKEGTSIEWIRSEITRHYIQLQEKDPTTKLVVFVDNFHDITVDSINFKDNNTQKFDHIADQLSHLCTQFDIPLICTAEFRKLNGNRRPCLDDIRESVKIGYESKAVLLCYNEVGLRGDGANIFWSANDDSTKKPVFEAHVGKNKYGSYKGRLFFDFRPEMSHLTEVDDEDSKRYNQMIHG